MSTGLANRVPLCSRRVSDVIEENEAGRNLALEEAKEQSQGNEDYSDLPWHHAQLAMLYGRQVADSIMHPKMERPSNAKAASKLKAKQGRAGARQLWTTLRDESNKKLIDQDKRIPSDLKGAYSAFVRQLVLQKGEVPVKRNFYEHEDVPDMDHLLDKRRVMKVLDVRHKRELMGRSSKINQDRTSILLYNNPLPDLVNASGEEGIERYLPSWIKDLQDDDSVKSYKKWLDSTSHPHSAAATSNRQPLKSSESMIELLRPLTRDKPRQHGPPTVKFLTEKEAGTEKGRFSEQYKSAREAAHKVNNPADALPIISADEDISVKPFRGDETVELEESISSKDKYKSPWQPLTLNALLGYSESKDCFTGEGDFMLGRVKMHRLKSAQPSTIQN